MVSALLAWRDRELDLLQRSPRPDDPVASLRLHSQTADQRLASETLTMTVKAGSTVPRTPQHPPPTPLLDLADDPAPRTPTAANDGRLPPTPPLLPIDDLPDFASLNLSDNEVIAPHLLKKVPFALLTAVLSSLTYPGKEDRRWRLQRRFPRCLEPAHR
jgi:hypothetical protein